jgi:hypothetical protein
MLIGDGSGHLCNNALKIALHASVQVVPDINVVLNHMRDPLAELREAVS